jgi:hypothetical protein
MVQTSPDRSPRPQSPGIAPRSLDSAEDELLYVMGRPPMAEDLGFLSSQVIGPDQPDARSLADAWRAANDVINELQTLEAGFADNPSLGDLHPAVTDARDRLLRDEAFLQAMAIVPIDIRMVELDRLVIPQKHVSLGSTRHIQSQFGGDPDPLSLFNLCVPLDHPRESVRCLRSGNESFVFVSSSHDLRFLDVFTLDAAQMASAPVRGVAATGLGLMIGYSFNCMTAMHVQNRLVLINGTHRATALRQMGITHAPCVIQKITRPEERLLIGPRELNRNPAEFLAIPRPTVLKDFLDPRLHQKVRVSRRMRQLKVSFSIDTMDTPMA